MRVVVIGGGFAGLAAAIALQEHRHEVTLLERRGVLGGRATSFPDTVTGEDVDNGTHLMIAAYTATLDLVLYAHNLGCSPVAVATELGRTSEEAARALRDIEQKRAATRYLHLPPLLVEPVPEIAHHLQGEPI